MKKILLGLLALSATLMAAGSTGVTGSTGDNQIDITTKAFIVDSGLIITDDNQDVALKSVELDHGTIMIGTSENSSVNRTINIKKTNGKPFPEDAVLEIALGSSHNNLTTAEGLTTIPHTLTAAIKEDHATAENSAQNLILAGETKESVNQFTIGNGVSVIEVTLQSDIASNAFLDTLLEGAYSNTSTLSVKFSKVPQRPGTEADKNTGV